MKKALIAAALVLALPAMAPAYGSDLPAFSQEKIVGLYVPLDDTLPLKQGEAGDVMLFVGAHGAFDNLFGWAEPGDGRHLKEVLQAMAPIETGVIVASKDYGIITPNGGESGLMASSRRIVIESYQGPVDYQVLSGNYPKVDLPAGHMSEGGASPS